MGPIGSKVIEVKDQIYVLFFFSVGHVFCLICLHRRNHLTATSRRVKFTSVLKICKRYSFKHRYNDKTNFTDGKKNP